MRFNFIRRAIHDVDLAAISLPAGNAGGEMLVGVRDATVVLVFKFVFCSIRGWIAALPESFDELLALFLVRELFESCALFVRDNPAHILVQPFLVLLTQLNLKRLGILLFLFFIDRTFERIGFLGFVGSPLVGRFILLRNRRRLCRPDQYG